MLIKFKPEEFRVEEVSTTRHEKNDCTIFTVEKTNWDTTLLVKEIAKRAGVSQKRVGYAGLKDKTAHSTQKMSIYGIGEDVLRLIKIPNVLLCEFEKGDRIQIGDLKGNQFSVVVRDINMDKSSIESAIKRSNERFNAYYGFINYFGYQRFGIQRPVTAEVGKYIVKKDYEQAAMTYLAKPYPLDPNKELRQELLNDYDFKKAYETFPPSLKYERSMLFMLANEGKDFKQCFNALPERLQTLFVHAYQAEIFNRIVKKRIKDIPPNEAEIGDIIMIDKFEKNAITKVNAFNFSKVQKMLKENVSVAVPLVGSKTKIPCSRIGEITKEVMDFENITFEDFHDPDSKTFSSAGFYRGMLGRFSNLCYEISEDEQFGANKCIFSFYLQKGQYATVFLQQIFDEEIIPYRSITL